MRNPGSPGPGGLRPLWPGLGRFLAPGGRVVPTLPAQGRGACYGACSTIAPQIPLPSSCTRSLYTVHLDALEDVRERFADGGARADRCASAGASAGLALHPADREGGAANADSGFDGDTSPDSDAAGALAYPRAQGLSTDTMPFRMLEAQWLLARGYTYEADLEDQVIRWYNP